MNTARKASDVLLELESSIEKILGYVHNMDMNIKTISNKLNALEKMYSSSSGLHQQVETVRQNQVREQAGEVKAQMPGLKPGVQIGPQRAVVAAPKGQQVSTTEDSADDFVSVGDQLEVDTKPIGHRRGIRTEEPSQGSERKAPVQQRIIYPDGKNVCLANVEIFETNSKGEFNLLKKVRTNSAGKWAVALASGKYLISISKSGTSTKPNVEVSYSVDIPVSSVPLELAPFTLGK
jgi:hypothetical protein